MLDLIMTSAQIGKTSVHHKQSSSEDYTHPHNRTSPTYKLNLSLANQ